MKAKIRRSFSRPRASAAVFFFTGTSLAIGGAFNLSGHTSHSIPAAWMNGLGALLAFGLAVYSWNNGSR